LAFNCGFAEALAELEFSGFAIERRRKNANN